ncbi:putative protein phosphatase 2C 10 [Symbiodinium microadriaticum]|uniref:PPM-type phosphatase domain-containing protein n=1 Tax=Symbiodinium microadriaticum TaxID=2951 RepID=A0A1Q9CL71_SYMMI|nr:putative protein phosphatase 2C 10 [Symbiodinium microadriaticum]
MCVGSFSAYAARVDQRKRDWIGSPPRCRNMRERVNGYPSVKRRCDMVSAASKSHVRSGSAPLLKAAQTGRARAAASAEWLGQAQGLEIDGELDGVNLGAEINGQDLGPAGLVQMRKAGHVRQRLSTSLPQGRCLTAPAERGGLSVESESAPKRKQEKKEKAKEKAPPPPRRTPTPSPARSESQKNLSDYEGELSRSPSRPKKRRAAPSGSPERVPPTQFEDYEPAGDGSGWYETPEDNLMRRLRVPSATVLAAMARMVRRASCAAFLALPVLLLNPLSFASSCRGRSLARRAKGEGKAFYDYIANDWSFSRDGSRPWDDLDFSVADLLPLSEAEVQALEILESKVPNWRKGFLTPDDERGVRRRFRILARAAGGEQQGLAALERNVGIMCVGERVTQAAAEALRKGLGEEGAGEVVRKNPGVLAIKASSLQGAGLARTKVAADIIDFFLGPGAFILEALKLLAIASVVKITYDLFFLPNGLIRAVYKKTAKWKFHPETGLYFHLKTQVYYTPKESDNRFFRRIDDDDDPLVKKMKQSEEMRRAISKTEFVKFEVEGAQGEDGPARAEDPAPAPKAPEKEEDTRMDGRVNKWDSEKGFGFIMPAGKEEGGEVGKGLFVHRKFIVGSTPTNPINLKEGVKVSFKQGTQDGKPCALEVLMLGADGKPLPIHAGAQTLEEKKKSYHVSAESLGLRVHCESWPGLKKTLQDRYVMDEPLEELGVYFAVLDGHGGTQVADMVKEKLHKNVLQQMRQKQVQPASRDEKIKLAIKEAFLQTDKEILALAERKKFELVGSTCVSVILHGNPKLGTALRLVVSNLGDSRAVLCRAGQAVPASEDHRPTRIDEKKRIERVGGLVLQVRGAWRVATSTNPNSMNKAARREYQGLAMTRSFGDLHFKRPIGLAIAEPEVRIVPLSDKDLFIVLATDGVYDVLSNQEVIDLAMRHWREPEEAAKNIVRSAYKRGSEDNLTVLVVQFGGTSCWADKSVPKYVGKTGGQGPVAAAATIEAGVVKGSSGPASAKAADDMDMFG